MSSNSGSQSQQDGSRHNRTNSQSTRRSSTDDQANTSNHHIRHGSTSFSSPVWRQAMPNRPVQGTDTRAPANIVINPPRFEALPLSFPPANFVLDPRRSGGPQESLGAYVGSSQVNTPLQPQSPTLVRSPLPVTQQGYGVPSPTQQVYAPYGHMPAGYSRPWVQPQHQAGQQIPFLVPVYRPAPSLDAIARASSFHPANMARGIRPSGAPFVGGGALGSQSLQPGSSVPQSPNTVTGGLATPRTAAASPVALPAVARSMTGGVRSPRSRQRGLRLPGIPLPPSPVQPAQTVQSPRPVRQVVGPSTLQSPRTRPLRRSARNIRFAEESEEEDAQEEESDEEEEPPKRKSTTRRRAVRQKKKDVSPEEEDEEEERTSAGPTPTRKTFPGLRAQGTSRARNYSRASEAPTGNNKAQGDRCLTCIAYGRKCTGTAITINNGRPTCATCNGSVNSQTRVCLWREPARGINTYGDAQAALGTRRIPLNLAN